MADGRGGSEALRIETAPTPDAGDGEIVVRVGAAGVNRPDSLQRQGFHGPAQFQSPIPPVGRPSRGSGDPDRDDAYSVEVQNEFMQETHMSMSEGIRDAMDRPAPESWRTTTQDRHASTSFGRIRVRVGGDEGGQVMVFWPSLLLDGSMWSHQFEHYAPTHRIVLIDPPGIGGSDPLRRPITVEDSSLCLKEILDDLGIRTCILVGSSWGSLVAVTFAAYHPDRLVAAVVTNGTATPPSTEVKARMAELVGNLEKFTTAPDWLLPATQGAFAGSTAEASKPAFMAYLGHVLHEDPLSIANAMRGILLGREDLHPVARMIATVPILILAGDEDRFFSISEGESLAHAVRGSRFVVLPETGHLSPRESPELVNAEIDSFLASLPATA